MKRRTFLKGSAAATAGTMVFPTIVPSHVLGKNAPSNKIRIGQIGFGRIAMTHDLPETLRHDMTLSLIHISEPTRPVGISRMPSSA